MPRFQRQLLGGLAAFVLTAGSAIAFGDDPPAGGEPSQASESLSQFRQELASRRPGLIAELSSADPAQVKKAIDEIDDWAKGAVASRRADIFEMLVDTKHYDEAEDRAVKNILKTLANNWAIEHLQKMRVKSFLKQGKNTEALSAAKVYYNVCRFAETKDAISLVGLCLAAVHPDDKTIARRFKEQQVAAASATQPAEGVEESILASISTEPSPFDAANVDGMVPTGYISYEAKGNLLLLVGRATDAKEAFDRAYDIASDQQIMGATENVARAIRAANGSVGPANAYLISVQQKK